MRTIKFRGQRFDKEFVYGYVQYFKDTDEYAIDDYAVNEDSISQFTGQHDKNGKEIYEGDILAHDYGGYSLIVYREECMAFCRIDAKDVGNVNGYYNLSEHAWRSCLQRARVIGNQYENPELLNYKEED